MKNNRLLPFLLFFASLAYGQVDFKRIVPPNPNVASLFKSTVTPVNEYSGQPNVSIPLYQIQEDGITHPITLSYGGGGIQVTEEAGLVGLGWALNVGGTITRSVRGNDDFAQVNVGYLNQPITKQPPNPFIGSNGYFNPDTDAFIRANSNCEFPVGPNNELTEIGIPDRPAYLDNDFMPDTFYYNFNGYSGSFVFDRFGNAVLIDRKGLDIQFNIPASNAGGSRGVTFTIRTENGTTYSFGQKTKEDGSNYELSIGAFTNAFTSFTYPTTTPGYTSSWFLTKITDISGNSIEFEYTKKINTIRPLRSFTQTYEVPSQFCGDCGSIAYNEYPGPVTEIEDFYLTRILCSNGKVEFDYSNNDERLDTNGEYLKTIRVIDNNDNLINDFDFDYSYFGSSYVNGNTSLSDGDFADVIQASSNNPHLNLRLRLDSVTENSIKTHSFDYFGGGSPNKTSLSQDYWGFYNGAPNRTSFIPEIRTVTNLPPIPGLPIKANRLPNEFYAKNFSLRKITYPTKGFTQFDYELNTFKATGTGNALPPLTVPKTAKAIADGSITNGIKRTDDAVTIRPNRNGTLYLSYRLALYGWNQVKHSTRPILTQPDFENNFYVQVKNKDTGLPLRTFRFDSNVALDSWNGNNGGPGGVAFFSLEEEWSNSPFSTYPLDADEYIIEAHFDDMDGSVFGQAQLEARWAEETVGQSGDIANNFSIGGGLRVKSISDHDHTGTLEMKRNFNYHSSEVIDGEEVTSSYGKIKTLPNYRLDHKEVLAMKVYSNGSVTFGDIRELPTVVGSATSHNTFSKDAGSYVGYDQVEVTYEGLQGDNGKAINKFHNTQDLFRSTTFIDNIDDYFDYPPIRVPHNGLLYKSENYKRTGNNYILVSETNNEYRINQFSATDFNLSKLYQNSNYVLSATKEIDFTTISLIGGGGNVFMCSNFSIQLYPHYSNLIQQTKSVSRVYDLNGQNPVTTIQDFAYENDTHLQRTRITSTDSKGDVVETKIYYPDDIVTANTLAAEGGSLSTTDFLQIQELKSENQHRIATPIQTVTRENGDLLSIQRNLFATKESIVLPSIVQTGKTTTSLEDRLIYQDYNANGKPVHVLRNDGPSTSYVWGYNREYPVAKVENSSYAAIEALSSFESGFDLGDNGLTTTQESQLRSLPGALVTTYSYDPLVGVTSVTDPRGYKVTYIYDDLNRLKEVRDEDNNIVTDYDYHYKGQTN